MISIQQLQKNYNRNIALRNLSIDLMPGQSVALIGPNGSGKSTLMKCILGQVFPQQGTITINGIDIKHHHQYRSSIGYMPQNINFPGNMKVHQLFTMMKDLRRQNAVDEELVTAFSIERFSDKRLSSLSGGMAQKVNAALAFLFDPPLLILDEPTAGLDPLSSEILKSKIKKCKDQGKLILISSHILADLEEIATHVLYLMDGQVQFFKSMETLINETGTGNLSKALARIIELENVDHAAH